MFRHRCFLCFHQFCLNERFDWRSIDECIISMWTLKLQCLPFDVERLRLFFCAANMENYISVVYVVHRKQHQEPRHGPANSVYTHMLAYVSARNTISTCYVVINKWPKNTDPSQSQCGVISNHWFNYVLRIDIDAIHAAISLRFNGSGYLRCGSSLFLFEHHSNLYYTDDTCAMYDTQAVA